MAGIYFHIPFCKKRCLYCDFFSNINMSQKDNYISALCKELSDRKEFLKNDIIETVYFGGGTPSQLSGNDFEKIFDQLNKHYNLANIKEVTRSEERRVGKEC